MVSVVEFLGELLAPSDPGYDIAGRLWNAMIDKRPAVIARCRATSDVVAALARARSDGHEVAVHCGGHSVSGLSSTDGGMMIDLRPMNHVEVDSSTRRASSMAGHCSENSTAPRMNPALRRLEGWCITRASEVSPSVAGTDSLHGSTASCAKTWPRQKW